MEVFKICKVSSLKALHPAACGELSDPHSLASSALAPALGSDLSLESRVEGLQGTIMSWHSHVGCWSHPDCVVQALTNLTLLPWLDYTLRLMHLLESCLGSLALDFVSLSGVLLRHPLRTLPFLLSTGTLHTF